MELKKKGNEYSYMISEVKRDLMLCVFVATASRFLLPGKIMENCLDAPDLKSWTCYMASYII